MRDFIQIVKNAGQHTEAHRNTLSVLESVKLSTTTPREEAMHAMIQWFARHSIVPKENLASPLEVFGLPHTEDIRVRLRDWDAGKVDAISQYTKHRDAFGDFVAGLGWHVTMEQPGRRGDLGVTIDVKIAPNYPLQSVEVPRILHHYTAARNLSAILRSGLQPRAQRDGDRYPPRVYLMLPGGRGAWEASQMLVDGGKANALLAVDTSLIPDATFYRDPELPDAGVWTYSAIPPEALTVIH